MKRIIKSTALILGILLLFASCSGVESDVTTTASNDTTSELVQPGIEYGSETVSDGEHPQVKFTMKDGGSFIIELYPEYAPQTVDNFIKLVSDGFYDGLTFHRVIDDFMAQGGDPDGTGMGGSKDRIFGEFAQNGFRQNTLSHTRGVVSMARTSNDFNSASSQFFICYGDETFLDGSYAAFGKVIKGMEVVDSFLETERTIGADGNKSVPVEPIVIEKAEVL
ncbi:MAG: peptidylprolyl isomerase [Oscillospiraceae bacterium]|nr:peptidylprolyl isomerase [Oscillospiraceae bacterium]